MFLLDCAYHFYHSFDCMRAFSCSNYDASLASISHNKIILFFNKKLAIGVKIIK